MMRSNAEECFPLFQSLSISLIVMRQAQNAVAHDTGLVKKDQVKIDRIYDAMKGGTMIALAPITNRAGDQLTVRKLACEFFYFLSSILTGEGWPIFSSRQGYFVV